MDHPCVSNCGIYQDWYMKTLFDDVVNPKDIFIYGLLIIGVCL